MSIFDKLKHAFHPVEQAVEHFSPDEIVHHLEDGVRHIVTEMTNDVRNKLPDHHALAQAVEVIEIARPTAIDIDLFAGFGVDLGVELQMEFGMGITVTHPETAVANLIDLANNPPDTVHRLCDKLWGIKPSEVRVYEKLQAVVGEQIMIKWDGDEVLERVVEYIGKRGWLEKKLRP